MCFRLIPLKRGGGLVTESCPTLCDPKDCSLSGSSVHRILQARILEWVAISFSRGSSRPRDRTCVSHIASGLFTDWATREALEEGGGTEFFPLRCNLFPSSTLWDGEGQPVSLSSYWKMSIYLLFIQNVLKRFHGYRNERNKCTFKGLTMETTPRRERQTNTSSSVIWNVSKIYYTPKHAFVVWDLLKVSRRCSLVRKFQRGQRCSWILLNIHLWCYKLTSRPRWLSLHSRTHRQRTHLELGPPYTFHSLFYVKTE